MEDLDWTTFPTRPLCFGNDPSNVTCSTPSTSMIDFLNITDVDTYKQMYCLNPPSDSCAFGYCPNPDIASPAVRASTYTGTVCLAILILYSPEDMIQSFYAQLLQIYSLMLAAIISIGLRQLTRLHAVFALTAAGSPLSLYLLTTAIRSLFSKGKLRLDSIFGRGHGRHALFNRAAVITGLPAWCTILIFIGRPSRDSSFQQPACDVQFKHNLVGRFFYGPVFILLERTTRTKLLLLTPFALLVMSWVVAFILQYKRITDGNNDVLWIRKVWRVITDTYPFIRFCTLILIPFAVWLAMLESGALFSNEHFTPTYGQILAIAAAIPPLVQCLCLLPRLGLWFVDLTWVRFITRRPKRQGSERGSGHIDPSQHNERIREEPTWGYSRLFDTKSESIDIGMDYKPGHAYSASVSSDTTLNETFGDRLFREYPAPPTPLSAAFKPSTRRTTDQECDNIANPRVTLGGGGSKSKLLDTPELAAFKPVDPYDTYRNDLTV